MPPENTLPCHLRTHYLATHHDSACHKWHVWVGLEPVVDGDDVQDVEQLTFVLVDTFHLHVKDGCRVDREVVGVLNEGS